MNNRYFDQLQGTQSDKTSSQDKKLTKNILDAYIKELPKEQIQENQRLGIKLQMNSYLKDETKETIVTGEFLTMLIQVYNIKNPSLLNIWVLRMQIFMHF